MIEERIKDLEDEVFKLKWETMPEHIYKIEAFSCGLGFAFGVLGTITMFFIVAMVG